MFIVQEEAQKNTINLKSTKTCCQNRSSSFQCVCVCEADPAPQTPSRQRSEQTHFFWVNVARVDEPDPTLNDSSVISPKPRLRFQPVRTAIKRGGEEPGWEDEPRWLLMTERRDEDCREAALSRRDEQREDRWRGFPPPGAFVVGRGLRLIGLRLHPGGKVQGPGLRLCCAELLRPRVVGQTGLLVPGTSRRSNSSLSVWDFGEAAELFTALGLGVNIGGLGVTSSSSSSSQSRAGALTCLLYRDPGRGHKRGAAAIFTLLASTLRV